MHVIATGATRALGRVRSFSLDGMSRSSIGSIQTIAPSGYGT
jgi:hypothetical protein